MRANNSELAAKLNAWADDDGSLTDVEVGSMVSEIVARAAGGEMWREVPQSYALQLFDIDGAAHGWPLTKLAGVLDAMRPHLLGEPVKSHWRASRIMAGDPLPMDMDQFWQDLLSEDALIYANPAAVVGPAIARGDLRFRPVSSVSSRCSLATTRAGTVCWNCCANREDHESSLAFTG